MTNVINFVVLVANKAKGDGVIYTLDCLKKLVGDDLAIPITVGYDRKKTVGYCNRLYLDGDTLWAVGTMLPHFDIGGKMLKGNKKQYEEIEMYEISIV